MVGNIFGGILGKVVENAEGILDKVITTDKERDAAKLAIKKLMLEAEKEAFAKVYFLFLKASSWKRGISAKVSSHVG